MLMRAQSLIAKIANGTIFGASRMGRIIGWGFSIVVLGGFLYMMSR